MTTHPFQRLDVASVFEKLPAGTRERLMYLRHLIFESAAETEGVGELEETLRWGEPAYLTTASKSGSMIRLNQTKAGDGSVGLYVICQTSLIDTYRQMYSHVFQFEGNRAIIFQPQQQIDEEALKHCISLALRYKIDRK